MNMCACETCGDPGFGPDTTMVRTRPCAADPCYGDLSCQYASRELPKWGLPSFIPGLIKSVPPYGTACCPPWTDSYYTYVKEGYPWTVFDKYIQETGTPKFPPHIKKKLPPRIKRKFPPHTPPKKEFPPRIERRFPPRIPKKEFPPRIERRFPPRMPKREFPPRIRREPTGKLSNILRDIGLMKPRGKPQIFERPKGPSARMPEIIRDPGRMRPPVIDSSGKPGIISSAGRKIDSGIIRDPGRMRPPVIDSGSRPGIIRSAGAAPKAAPKGPAAGVSPALARVVATPAPMPLSNKAVAAAVSSSLGDINGYYSLGQAETKIIIPNEGKPSSVLPPCDSPGILGKILGSGKQAISKQVAGALVLGGLIGFYYGNK